MNNDLISREALKKKIDKFIGYLDEDMIYRIKVVIDKIPTVAVDNYSMGYQDGVRKVLSERPKGEWVKKYKGQVNSFCSKCDYEVGKITNYCPNCGADMHKRKEITNDKI